MRSFSFDIFCFELQLAWNWFFFSFFFFKEFILPVFSACLFKELLQFWASRNNHTTEKQTESWQGEFCCLFRAIKNWWEKACISHVVKHIIRWESDGRKVPIRWWRKWLPISQALPIRWVSLHFLMLWEINGERDVFHIL